MTAGKNKTKWNDKDRLRIRNEKVIGDGKRKCHQHRQCQLSREREFSSEPASMTTRRRKSTTTALPGFSEIPHLFSTLTFDLNIKRKYNTRPAITVAQCHTQFVHIFADIFVMRIIYQFHFYTMCFVYTRTQNSKK